jgi:hypothetical protein
MEWGVDVMQSLFLDLRHFHKGHSIIKGPARLTFKRGKITKISLEQDNICKSRCLIRQANETSSIVA